MQDVRPHRVQIFELQMMTNCQLCLITSCLDLPPFHLAGFRVGISVVEIRGKMLHIVSFEAAVNGRVEDLTS